MKPFNSVQKTNQMNLGMFKNVMYKMCLEIIYSICMYKKDLALNDLQWLICHKTKPNQPLGIYQKSYFPPQISTLSFSVVVHLMLP